MPKINLKYGNSEIPFEFDENQFEILGNTESNNLLSDVEIGKKLENPIDSKTFEEIIQPNETVLIVVPDATRKVACGQVVNLLVRRLIANGTMPFEINIIFATGIHRKVTEAEQREILTPFIAQRIKTFNHNARDLVQFLRLGETSDGIPIELNRKLNEYDHTIIIGGINFHYFAGFTGGRKLICPGLGSSRTISGTHKLAFDCETFNRREGVGVGKLKSNPVHEAFINVVEKMPPTFAINTIVNDKGELLDLFCGDWKTSHEKACKIYAEKHTIKIDEKRDLVIVSSGGFPHDLNMIQAHKALEMASHSCKDGGTIIFLAECENGLGRNDFLDWFAAKESRELAEKLCEKYQVNGQTAWSLLKKAEKFNIKILTDLPKEICEKMRLDKVDDVEKGFAEISKSKKGYILPSGAKFKIEKGG
ncbi:MAG: nickel-dependent lactate racemase [Acidobacteriota bacterium]|jgi:nickel-dependent lactate racemase|nr:nickel-dependent lactate racemase [Acidobacteriota bacterium]